MKGKELHEIVKQSGLTIKAVSNLSGIAERTISSLYKKSAIEQHYIDDLKKALPSIAKYGNEQKEKGNNVLEAYDQIIQALENKVDSVKKSHDKLEKDHYVLRGEVSMLKELLRPIKK